MGVDAAQLPGIATRVLSRPLRAPSAGEIDPVNLADTSADGTTTGDELAAFLSAQAAANKSLVIYDADGNELLKVEGGEVKVIDPSLSAADPAATEAAAAEEVDPAELARLMAMAEELAEGEEEAIVTPDTMPEDGLKPGHEGTWQILNGGIIGNSWMPATIGTAQGIHGRKWGTTEAKWLRLVEVRDGVEGISRDNIAKYLRAAGLEVNAKTVRALFLAKEEDWISVDEFNRILKNKIKELEMGGISFREWINWTPIIVDEETLGTYLVDNDVLGDSTRAKTILSQALQITQYYDENATEPDPEILAKLVLQEYMQLAESTYQIYDVVPKMRLRRMLKQGMQDEKVLSELTRTDFPSTGYDGKPSSINLFRELVDNGRLPSQKDLKYLWDVHNGKVKVNARPHKTAEEKAKEKKAKLDAGSTVVPAEGEAGGSAEAALSRTADTARTEGARGSSSPADIPPAPPVVQPPDSPDHAYIPSGAGK